MNNFTSTASLAILLSVLVTNMLISVYSYKQNIRTQRDRGGCSLKQLMFVVGLTGVLGVTQACTGP